MHEQATTLAAHVRENGAVDADGAEKFVSIRRWACSIVTASARPMTPYPALLMAMSKRRNVR
jgi:hypothetical protein